MRRRKWDERGGSGWLYVNRQALRLDLGLALKNGMVYGAVDNSWCFCDACEQWDCEKSHVDSRTHRCGCAATKDSFRLPHSEGTWLFCIQDSVQYLDDSRGVMARLQNSIRYWDKITKIELHRGWVIAHLGSLHEEAS